MIPVFSIESHALSPDDDERFIRLLASEGISVVERMVRSELARCAAIAGQATLDSVAGISGQGAVVKDEAEKSIRYRNFLEVLEELKALKKRQVHKVRTH